mgnify:CR=1 FL=1
MRFFMICLMLLWPLAASAGESSQSGADALPSAKTEAFSAALESRMAAEGVHVALVVRLARDQGSLPKGI